MRKLKYSKSGKKRGRFIEDNGIISFQDCINAIKKYSEENDTYELTKIFVMQMFVVKNFLSRQ